MMKPSLQGVLTALENVTSIIDTTIEEINQFCEQQESGWIKTKEGRIQLKKVNHLKQMRTEIELMNEELVEIEIDDELAS